jgi:AcrR family transcriptional regulator
MSDLTKAMGVNRPSLYAAFGNKEALFRKLSTRTWMGEAPTGIARLRVKIGSPRQPCAGEAAIRLRFEYAKSEGDIPAHVPAGWNRPPRHTQAHRAP